LFYILGKEVGIDKIRAWARQVMETIMELVFNADGKREPAKEIVMRTTIFRV
jgi:hypothetical protein